MPYVSSFASAVHCPSGVHVGQDAYITADLRLIIINDGFSGAESGMGPILLNWMAPPTSERSSPGRGILISAHLSRATRGTIGRL